MTSRRISIHSAAQNWTMARRGGSRHAPRRGDGARRSAIRAVRSDREALSRCAHIGTRPVAARLTGFPYAPLESVANPTQTTARLRGERDANEVLKDVEQRHDPVNLHAAGVALVSGTG